MYFLTSKNLCNDSYIRFSSITDWSDFNKFTPYLPYQNVLVLQSKLSKKYFLIQFQAFCLQFKKLYLLGYK